jgi:hypothetical protein
MVVQVRGLVLEVMVLVVGLESLQEVSLLGVLLLMFNTGMGGSIALRWRGGTVHGLSFVVLVLLQVERVGSLMVVTVVVFVEVALVGKMVWFVLTPLSSKWLDTGFTLLVLILVLSRLFAHVLVFELQVGDLKNIWLIDSGCSRDKGWFSLLRTKGVGVGVCFQKVRLRIYLRVHKKKTCYKLMHGRTPKVSHFHVFGCKCFILKKGKKLDKFETRSVDGIFFGYASHSRAYRVLNLETNQIVETCEVTFDETQPCTQLVFECAGDDELSEEIFQEKELEHGDDEDGGVVPPAEHVHTTSTTVVDGPSPTPTTTNQDRAEATVEGVVASRREPPRRVQADHPASRIIGDLNERTTRTRVRNNSHFAHATFVATLDPKDIGHALSDHNWVNSMHEELENFERNQVWELVDPPPGCKPIGTKWV